MRGSSEPGARRRPGADPVSPRGGWQDLLSRRQMLGVLAVLEQCEHAAGGQDFKEGLVEAISRLGRRFEARVTKHLIERT